MKKVLDFIIGMIVAMLIVTIFFLFMRIILYFIIEISKTKYGFYIRILLFFGVMGGILNISRK